MTATSVTPVTLLTGFLGSGKTTLLNRLVAHPAAGDCAVIVNEFGPVAIDHALKTAQVTMVKFFGPPTETNFASAYLAGELTEVEAAARAFAEAVIEVADHPLSAAVRPMRERR